MGSGVINSVLNVHTQPSWAYNQYSFSHHQANLNVDTESDPFDQLNYEAIKSAAKNGTQAQFDAVCTAAVGSWYAAQSTAYRAVLKAQVTRL